MHEPDAYALSPALTLAQVADPTPPPGFAQFWSDWSRRTFALRPRLEPIDALPQRDQLNALGATHTFTSTGHTRIAARLILPADEPLRGLVVTTHGYALPDDEPLTDANPWSIFRLGVLKLRLRGYPGSDLDSGPLVRAPEGYACLGLDAGQNWIIFDALADLVLGARALRTTLGPFLPLSLHGESFGGGLAVVAASLMSDAEPVARLAVGLPSLGWWDWRLDHRAHAGIGADVQRIADTRRERAQELLGTLKLADAVVHARRLTCPFLCKVALRDDVVPAPTVAAIYNAAGCDPGTKWRFVTRYGHFDGGLADARRHALFDRLSGSFLDPARDPAQLMRDWEPILHAGERGPAPSLSGA